MLGLLSSQGPDLSSLARADEIRRPVLAPRPKRPEPDMLPGLFKDPVPSQAVSFMGNVLPKGRNFQ